RRENRIVSEPQAAAAAAGSSQRNLITRIASAVVLVPLAIAAAYAGGWDLTAVGALGAVWRVVEWLIMTSGRGHGPLWGVGAVALALAAPFLAIQNVGAALFVMALGVIGVAFRASTARWWAIAGFIYAAAALVASILVRLDRTEGFVALVFILLAVWCSDIG